MFIEELLKIYGIDRPIFTEEILELLKEYSRAQVFRDINSAKKNNELVQFDKGVYYIPSHTFWGEKSTITVDDVIEKKYLKNEDSVYGIYGGLKLLNRFSITTQMPAVVEIITNNETTRCREITMKERKFILKKSRFLITKDNYTIYTILQLFNDFSNEDIFDENLKQKLFNYIQEKNVSIQQLIDLSNQFPARVSKRLLQSGVINAFA